MLPIAGLLPFACTEGEPNDNATVPEACATADQRLVSDRAARTFAMKSFLTAQYAHVRAAYDPCASPHAAGQGVHRPGQHRPGARLLTHIPRGLPDASRRGWDHLLLKTVVRHGALHFCSQCALAI